MRRRSLKSLLVSLRKGIAPVETQPLRPKAFSKFKKGDAEGVRNPAQGNTLGKDPIMISNPLKGLAKTGGFNPTSPFFANAFDVLPLLIDQSSQSETLGWNSLTPSA